MHYTVSNSTRFAFFISILFCFLSSACSLGPYISRDRTQITGARTPEEAVQTINGYLSQVPPEQIEILSVREREAEAIVFHSVFAIASSGVYQTNPLKSRFVCYSRITKTSSGWEYNGIGGKVCMSKRAPRISGFQCALEYDGLIRRWVIVGRIGDLSLTTIQVSDVTGGLYQTDEIADTFFVLPIQEKSADGSTLLVLDSTNTPKIKGPLYQYCN